MWKDAYKTGIERIDVQHKTLFEKTAEFLRAIDDNAPSYVLEGLVTFLKGYVVYHFRDEEAYQRRIGYPDYVQHKKAHEAFTRSALEMERRLKLTNDTLSVAKDLAGMLSAWLIYHVANTDLKMARGEAGVTPADATNIGTIAASARETLQTLMALAPSQIRETDAAAHGMTGDVHVGIEMFGDLNGTLLYSYDERIAMEAVERMTLHTPPCIDEMVCSALAEITNISTGNATIKLSRGGTGCDIRPPRLIDRPPQSGFQGVVLDTGVGKLKITANLDHY